MAEPISEENERQIRAPSKPLFVLGGVIQTPPMSSSARVDVGYYLRKVQDGEKLAMPLSRPMPTIGSGCHELRISDARDNVQWRVMYHVDNEVVLILEVFKKKTAQTPDDVLQVCRQRLNAYLQARERR